MSTPENTFTIDLHDQDADETHTLTCWPNLLRNFQFSIAGTSILVSGDELETFIHWALRALRRPKEAQAIMVTRHAIVTETIKAGTVSTIIGDALQEFLRSARAQQVDECEKQANRHYDARVEHLWQNIYRAGLNGPQEGRANPSE